MAPGLKRGTQVEVTVLEESAYEPKRGDVVLLRRPDGWGQGEFVVRRVVGLPGEEISCCSSMGLIYVGSTPIEEPYVHTAASARATTGCSLRDFLAKVPAGQLFVLSDKRSNAIDSRCLGAVPLSAVVGVWHPA